MKKDNRIIVALDGMSSGETLRFAKKLKGLVWGFKVNDLLFSDSNIIQKLKKFGKVFADAKLHDIPNTVENSVKKLSVAGADIITVHASGGVEMMKAAEKNAGKCKIIAVTVLTSLPDNPKEVARLTRDALEAGVDGIVCSGTDLELIKNISGSAKLLKIVPGIRPDWYKKSDDQRRKVTPAEVIKSGADYLVIGRPITSAKDPFKALLNLYTRNKNFV